MIRFRFRRLIEKILSVKFVIFVAATILRCVGVIGCGEWLTIALVVITGREIQKWKCSGVEVLGNSAQGIEDSIDEESFGSD